MKIYDFDGQANIVGKRVRQARVALKMSQEELAAQMQLNNINITQKAISRMEQMVRFVSDYELLALSKVLDVDIVWLLTGQSDEYKEDLRLG